MKAIGEVREAIWAAFSARDAAALTAAMDDLPAVLGAGAQKRIQQLIKMRKEDRAQLLEETAYFERVAQMMIPMLPKQTVARILEAAKQGSLRIAQGGNGNVSVSSEIRSHHYAQAQPAHGAGAAGRQTAARGDGEAQVHPQPHRPNRADQAREQVGRYGG